MSAIKKLLKIIVFVLLLAPGIAQAVICTYKRLRHKETGQLVEFFGDFHLDIASDVSPGFDQKRWLRDYISSDKATTSASVEDVTSFLHDEKYARTVGNLGIQDSWDNWRGAYSLFNDPIALRYKGIMFTSAKRIGANNLYGLATVLQDLGVSVHNSEEDRRPFKICLEEAAEKLGVSAITRPVLQPSTLQPLSAAAAESWYFLHKFFDKKKAVLAKVRRESIRKGTPVLTADGKQLFELNPKEQRGLMGLYRIQATKALRKVSKDPQFACIHRYMKDIRPIELEKELSSSFINRKEGVKNIKMRVATPLVDLQVTNETIKNAQKKHMVAIMGDAHVQRTAKILEESGHYEVMYKEGSDETDKNGILSVLDLTETIKRARLSEQQQLLRKADEYNAIRAGVEIAGLMG